MSLRDLTRRLGGGPADEASPAERARALLDVGRLHEACDLLAAESATLRGRGPHGYETDKAFWDLAVRIDREDEAVDAFLRCVRAELSRSHPAHDPSLAAFHWFELVDRLGHAPPLDLETRLGLAEAMLEQADYEASAAELLEEVEDDPSQSPAVRVRLASAAARSRSASAERLATPALALSGLPPARRAALEAELEAARAEGLRPSQAQKDGAGPIELVEMSVARSLQRFEAVPLAIDGEYLSLELKPQGRRRIALDKVQAVAAARIDTGDSPVYVLVDLLLDSLWADTDTLRTLRLRSHEFDPQSVADGADAQLALQTFLRNVLAVSGAVPLPDPSSAVGEPFHTFSSEREYAARVLDITG